MQVRSRRLNKNTSSPLALLLRRLGEFPLRLRCAPRHAVSEDLSLSCLLTVLVPAQASAALLLSRDRQRQAAASRLPARAGATEYQQKHRYSSQDTDGRRTWAPLKLVLIKFEWPYGVS